MLRRWIGSLRNKPKAVRDNVALSVAGGATALVALGWLFITPETVTTVASEVKEQPNAFSTLFGQLREQTAAVTDSFSNARQTVGEEWEAAVASSTFEEAESERTTTSTSATTTETTATSSNPVSEPTGRTVRIATTSDSE